MKSGHQFDIEVSHHGAIMPFTVKVKEVNGAVDYEVWKGDQHSLTFSCCEDETGDSLKVTSASEDNLLDSALIDKIAEVIESEEE